MGTRSRAQAAKSGKRSRARRIAFAGALICGGLALALLAARILNPPFTVDAYALSTRERRAVEEAALSWSKSSGRDLPVLRFKDGASSIAADIARWRRADLVIFKPGMASQALVGGSLPLPAGKEGLFSSTVRWAGTSGRAFYAAPLFLDSFQLLCDPAHIKGAGLPLPYGSQALETTLAALAASGKAALASGKSPLATLPLLIPGADDLTMVMLVSSMLSSAGGSSAYDALALILAKSDPKRTFTEKEIKSIFSESLPSDGGKALTLGQACAPIRRWAEQGMLHHDWLKFDGRATRSLIEAGTVAMLLSPLSFQRSLGQEALYGWESLRFMPWDGSPRAGLAGPVTAAAAISASHRPREALAFRDWLLGADGQFGLAEGSGTTPAVMSARAPDVQSGAVKTWAIQSDRILQGLALDSGIDEARLAAAFRLYFATAE